jgi:hypothetical protein
MNPPEPSGRETPAGEQESTDDPLSSGPPDYDSELPVILIVVAAVPVLLLLLAGISILADAGGAFR